MQVGNHRQRRRPPRPRRGIPVEVGSLVGLAPRSRVWTSSNLNSEAEARTFGTFCYDDPE